MVSALLGANPGGQSLGTLPQVVALAAHREAKINPTTENKSQRGVRVCGWVLSQRTLKATERVRERQRERDRERCWKELHKIKCVDGSAYNAFLEILILCSNIRIGTMDTVEILR